MHTNGYDEALNLPTEQAAGIALKTQQIAAFESGISETADPLGGSYFIENLTDEIESGASEIIAKIDALGGSVHAIEQGYIQNEIAKSAYAYQQAIESGKKIIVGVNKFQNERSASPPPFKIDDDIRLHQSEKLKSLKQKRDNDKVIYCLQIIKECAENGTNLMPAVIEAVENYCTLGEISDTLRRIFGEFK